MKKIMTVLVIAIMSIGIIWYGIRTSSPDRPIPAEPPLTQEQTSQQLDALHATHATIPAQSEPETAQSPTQTFSLSGETLRYPKGVSEDVLRAVIPELKCFDFQGLRGCSATTSLGQRLLLDGMPGNCNLGEKFSAHFTQNKLSGFECDIAPILAEKVANLLNEKYQFPNTNSKTINGMQIFYSEWKSGDDYILLSHYTGNDAYGRVLDNFHVSIDDSAQLDATRETSQEH